MLPHLPPGLPLSIRHVQFSIWNVPELYISCGKLGCTSIVLVRHRKLDFGLNLFLMLVYSFFQLILVAKGTHFKNLPGAGLAPLGNLRYRLIFATTHGTRNEQIGLFPVLVDPDIKI